MNILDALMAAQGGGAVKQLGQQFGLGDDQTTRRAGGARAGARRGAGPKRHP